MARGSAPGERRGGRTKGTPNKRSAAMAVLASSTGDLPHEFLLRVSRGEVINGVTPSFDQRMQAAKDAAPYYAPKLAAVEHSGKDGGPIEMSWKAAQE